MSFLDIAAHFAVFFLFLFFASPVSAASSRAIFAGGCFWCVESDFEEVDGVISATSGYSGGDGANPDYHDYAAKGHMEVVEVVFDPAQVSYDDLLDVFWHHVDPTDPGGQFVDRGPQYATAIFYLNDDQRRRAESSKAALEKRGVFSKAVVTPIRPAVKFYPAEDYHQDYHKKNPLRYKFYRHGSGRDRFIAKVWGKAAGRDSDADLKKKLTRMQYYVVRENGTEPPFKNAYWNNGKEGIYVDVVSGEPLFSSRDKFKSGTGWPSFTRPLVKENIITREDRSFFSLRTEVRSRVGGSHLGHVFNDGPEPTGRRYCINSAALRFVPVADLEEQGYGEFSTLFSAQGGQHP